MKTGNDAKQARLHRRLALDRKRQKHPQFIPQLLDPISAITPSKNARLNRMLILSRKRRRSGSQIPQNTSQQQEGSSVVMDIDVIDKAKLARRYRTDYLRNKRNRSTFIPPERTTTANMDVTFHDNGDPNVVCAKCQALMWNEEKTQKLYQANQPIFTQCCMGGKSKLPLLCRPPEYLQQLLENNDSIGRHFVKNIRAYNMMFSFTSMGGKIDTTINTGKGPYVYRMHGQNYHCIGSLLPVLGTSPKFLQLYIHDTDNEIDNRISAIRTRDNSNDIEWRVVNGLQNMLDTYNPYCQAFRMTRNRVQTTTSENIRLKLIGTRNNDGRMYNLPSSSEVAALVIDDANSGHEKRDIIIEHRDGTLKRINELHPAYLPLQYPLLFPLGEDGYRVDIPYGNITDLSVNRRSRLSMREFFSYRIHDRIGEASTILRSRKLFQQFLVDAYTMIEAERLNYIRYNQTKLRSDTYDNVARAASSGSKTAENTGKRIILPSSFTGGSRYMIQNYMDAMALCKTFGYPDLFITFTCNPKWPEIVRFLQPRGLQPEDRPDIVCRLFKIKLNNLMKDLKERRLFGRINAAVYTVEFQKRGLPHAHILLFLHADDKLQTADDIDKTISAEIPSHTKFPHLYEAVQNFMIHGPCGTLNARSPCMKNDKCSKNFPKKFQQHTSFDKVGYPIYKRRDDGNQVEKNGILLDNRFVVPYNKTLLLRYQAHINVEWCNQSRSIKYLFKYINKGYDRVSATITQSPEAIGDGNVPVVDEIKKYYNCRYISPCEAVWRIFMFDIHYRTPPVERLSFHLPNKQPVVFNGEDDIDDVMLQAGTHDYMFMAWMHCNEVSAEARNLTYVQFPNNYVWQPQRRKWKIREKGFSIGRIHHVPIGCGEAYYLRVLLNIVKGPKNFEDLRTVDEVVYTTFKEACYARGLLDDDKEYIDGIIEASYWQSATTLRLLFAMLLMSNSLANARKVWFDTWHYLSDDIVYTQGKIFGIQDFTLSDDQIQNYSLAELEKILNKNGSTLREHTSMPYPSSIEDIDIHNKLIRDELCYDRNVLAESHSIALSKFTAEQYCVYESIIGATNQNKGGVFFLYGHGGTGKTFVWSSLANALRSRGDVVLTVASSGIAALLLDGGRTAHSRFSIPISINEDSTCNIKQGTHLAELIAKTKLIIWDEAPMVHKHCFEALDKTLKDIMTSVDSNRAKLPFGGKVIVFGGDFRQILPVITKGTRQDIISATINSSYIWQYCSVLRLTRNMRLEVNDEGHSSSKLRNFANWLLKVGDGFVNEENDGYEVIDLPEECLLHDSLPPIESISKATYPNIAEKLFTPNYFQERAILTPTHDIVETMNDYLLSLLDGEERLYLSSDSISLEDRNPDFNDDFYSNEFLNSLRCSGLPNHVLRLKVGVPVMLLRNVNQSEGLCNGTRLQITRLGDHIIEAKIITGRNINQKILIPRIILTTSDYRFPFNFQRRQFPIIVCFAMTINKSQGQSLAHVGLFLPKPVFSHGQLYVALSRVRSMDGLKILICNKDGKRFHSTTNVVYKEVFQNI